MYGLHSMSNILIKKHNVSHLSPQSVPGQFGPAV